MGGKPVGRRAGGHNRGFWYRKNRGWYTTQGAASIPLCAETGEHLIAPEQEAEAEKAYGRWLLSDKPTKQGRRTGGSNKGYWYRKNRGWYTTEGQLKVPLLDKAGEHLKDPQTPDEVLKDAYARYRLGIQEQMKREAVGDTALIHRICQDYLDHAKTNNRQSTFEKRGEYLFDFCHGLPAKFWDYGRGRQVSEPTAADYIHDGYCPHQRPLSGQAPRCEPGASGGQGCFDLLGARFGERDRDGEGTSRSLYGGVREAL